MKIVQVSDIHLGFALNEYSLYEDQIHLLCELEAKLKEVKPDVILVPGDIFDSSQPKDDALKLYDQFINVLASSPNVKAVFITQGNHDPKELLRTYKDQLRKLNIYVASKFDGLRAYPVDDEYGTVNFYLLPYIRPSVLIGADGFLPMEERDTIKSYADAVEYILCHTEVDKSVRNVLLCHQWIEGALKSDTERSYVGGSEEIPKNVFCDYDYVAVGHLHNAKTITYEDTTIRYSGTPMPYSFQEAKSKRSITVTELKAKGVSPVIDEVEMSPLHILKEIKGTYTELLSDSMKELYTKEGNNYLLRIVVTDNDLISDVRKSLKNIYHNMVTFDRDTHFDSVSKIEIKTAEELRNMDPMEVFEDLFRTVMNCEMTDEEKTMAKDIIDDIFKKEA